jgi:hypothetical protein
MAKNREMLKEAIAEAKAVKEMAIANAKAALEEAFTPQLKSMLSLKLQEMEKEDLEEENIEEEGFGKTSADSEEGFGVGMDEKALDEEKDEMMEVDLEELLAELELEEGDEVEEGEGENLYEAEEEGEEEGEEEEGEEEEGDMEMGDLSDDEIKDMIEDVIAQMIKDGELEAGPEFGGEEEGEEMEMDAEEEEEVDLAELLREIEEMEDLDEAEEIEESETLNEWYWEAGDPSITIAFLTGGLGGFIALAGAYFAGVKKYKADQITKNLAFVSTIKDPAKQKDYVQKIVDTIGDNKSLQKQFKDELDKIQSGLKNLSEAGETGDPVVDAVAGALEKAGIDPSAAVSASEKAEAAVEKATQGGSTEMAEELSEALSTIESLKAEINEINLLNAKLLYSNKIFKAKNLNENQKVKVLSSFDKAKNVGEVKMVYETLNEGIKVAKNTIKENLGRASKSTITPTTKQPIVESNDVFKRMQKLAGII